MIMSVARQFEPCRIMIFDNSKSRDVPQSDDGSRCLDARPFLILRLGRGL